MSHKLLIINLGSTSTKIAVYSDLQEDLFVNIVHSSDDLSKFVGVLDQSDFRKEKIICELSKNGYKLEDFDIIVSRGGCLKPTPTGIYIINEDMIKDLHSGRYGVHPTNLGGIIAYEIGRKTGVPAITVDPPTSDELCNLARFSGLKEIQRISSFHALNQKRTAIRVAKDVGKDYLELNLIVVHLGGGISVAAHEKGFIVDVNNALDGEGPFSPERSGSLPAVDLIKKCYSGQYSEEEMIRKVKGKGGLMSYLGTNSGLDVEKRIEEGDEYALMVFEAMAYQVSKEICSNLAVLKGKVDAIALTGSLAFSQRLNNWIKGRTEFIAPILIYPGENEILSLAENSIKYLNGESQPKVYFSEE